MPMMSGLWFERTEHRHLASGQELLGGLLLICGVLFRRDRRKPLLRQHRTCRRAWRQRTGRKAQKNGTWTGSLCEAHQKTRIVASTVGRPMATGNRRLVSHPRKCRRPRAARFRGRIPGKIAPRSGQAHTKNASLHQVHHFGRAHERVRIGFIHARSCGHPRRHSLSNRDRLRHRLASQGRRHG